MNLDSNAFELTRTQRQDAHEKAFEIMVKGQRDYEHKFNKLVRDGDDTLRKEFEKKIDDQRKDHRIAVSKKTNQMRLEKMKRRNECMEDLRKSAAYRLQNDFDGSNPQYRETLKKLIIQVSSYLMT